MAEEHARAGGPLARLEAALAERRLLIQRCAACGHHAYPPRRRCPACHADALQSLPASGRGQVYATTTVARRAEKGGDYNVALVELVEGVRLMSRVEGVAPEAVRIGMAVRAGFTEAPGGPLLVFRPEGG